MIVRKDDAVSDYGADGDADKYGAFEEKNYSDTGGLTQYGAYVRILEPGSRSSDRHWHEKEDEFIYVLSGEATVVENDGAHVLMPGDAACWPAGSPNAHYVVNRSDSPCSYLIVGTRPTHDICHYPDLGRACHTEGETWRMMSYDGEYLGGGKVT